MVKLFCTRQQFVLSFVVCIRRSSASIDHRSAASFGCGDGNITGYVAYVVVDTNQHVKNNKTKSIKKTLPTPKTHTRFEDYNMMLLCNLEVEQFHVSHGNMK